MSECDIYLEFETPERRGANAVSLRLPVMPEQLSFSRMGDNVSSSTLKIGEVNILRKPKLVTFQIESFFPRTAQRSFIRGRESFYTPDFYLTMLTWLQDTKTPAKAVFVGLDIEAMFVSVESFTFNYAFADDDVAYSLALKEFKPYSPNMLHIMTINPLFSGDKVTAYNAVGVARQKTGFCIGDKVIVNGSYFRTPDGEAAFLKVPIDFMCKSYAAAATDIFDTIKNAPSSLVEQEAVIIGIRRNGPQLIKGSLPGDLQTKTESNVRFPYQIAVNKRALGWVSETSIRHAT